MYYVHSIKRKILYKICKRLEKGNIRIPPFKKIVTQEVKLHTTSRKHLPIQDYKYNQETAIILFHFFFNRFSLGIS